MCIRRIAAAFGFALSLTCLATYVQAAGIDDPRRADYFKDFAGKTIAFLPVTMGIDLTEGWAAVMRQQADRLGMKFEIRDPHFQRRRRRASDHLAHCREARRSRRA